MRLGIIPAAGRAERFGGLLKELLPIRDGVLLMDYSLRWLQHCRHIICVTSLEKIGQLSRHYPDLLFAIQRDDRDIWGAIRTALEIDARYYDMAMPDTITNEQSRSNWHSDLTFGVFKTDQPERFGVIADRRIRDKDESLKGTKRHAWGTISWSRKIRNYWLAYDHQIVRFDQALSLAMAAFEFSTFKSETYQDIASWEDYQEAIHAYSARH